MDNVYIEALLSLLRIDGFMEIYGVLCAVFVLIGAWLPTRKAKLLPTLVAVLVVVVGQEMFRYLYFRSIAVFYLRAPMVSLLTALTAAVMMSAGYIVSDGRNGYRAGSRRAELERVATSVTMYEEAVQEKSDEEAAENADVHQQEEVAQRYQ